jgi:hypothetical protein
MMLKSLLFGGLALTLAACGGGASKDVGDGASSKTSDTRSLDSGTRVNAVLQTGLSSRTSMSGEMIKAIVSSDVADDRGTVVIPSGSVVTLTIDKIEPGNDQVRPDGRLWLVVSSVTLGGDTYALDATLDPVAHTMAGRGITGDEAARIAAGTAIGAGVGQVISKNTRGTVIGGAVGAVAGGAVAVRYAYRDVVVSADTPISFTLTQPLNVTAK